MTNLLQQLCALLDDLLTRFFNALPKQELPPMTMSDEVAMAMLKMMEACEDE